MANKCAHTRVKEKLEFKEKFGKQTLYCTQCMKWVDVDVKPKGDETEDE